MYERWNEIWAAKFVRFPHFFLALPQSLRYRRNRGNVAPPVRDVGISIRGSTVYVACSTLCFAAQPLDEALRHIREMNFSKADITVSEAGPHLKPSELAADSGKIGQKLKASNMPIAAIHAEFKEPDGEATRSQLRGVCRLARQLAVPLISTAAAPLGSDLDQETARLKEWARIADSEGVILTVETNSHTLTADPAVAAELWQTRPRPGADARSEPLRGHSGRAEGL